MKFFDVISAIIKPIMIPRIMKFPKNFLKFIKKNKNIIGNKI